MARSAVETNSRFEMRLSPEEKSKLMRAAALEMRDLSDFVLRTALRAADDVIEENARMKLSAEDTKLWMDLLENPPEPNERLVAAARALLANEHIKLA